VREGTSVNSVSATAVLDRWLSFALPDHLLGIALKGRYRGQRQLWFALRFNGSDGEFDLRRHVAHWPEFEGRTWAPPCDAISRAVPWKKTMYTTVLPAFGGLIKAV
jgi:putative (di)nucleoside polyphosphate hydrolase